MTFILRKALLLLLIFITKEISSFRCDRRPYGATTHASPSDGRFKLEVIGADNKAYIPEQLYNGTFVILFLIEVVNYY